MEQVLRDMPLIQIRRNSRGEAQPGLHLLHLRIGSAVGFVAGVVEPFMSGLGGGGFLGKAVVRRPWASAHSSEVE